MTSVLDLSRKSWRGDARQVLDEMSEKSVGVVREIRIEDSTRLLGVKIILNLFSDSTEKLSKHISCKI